MPIKNRRAAGHSISNVAKSTNIHKNRRRDIKIGQNPHHVTKNNQHQCQILEVCVETTSVVDTLCAGLCVETTSVVDTHEPDLARPVASISLSELERHFDFSGVCRLKTEGRQGIQ